MRTSAIDSATPPIVSRRAELVERTASIAAGSHHRRQDLHVSRELARRIDRAERRALAHARAGGLCDEGRRAAAIAFLGEVVTVLVLDGKLERGEARELVAQASDAIDISSAAAALAVFMRAVASSDATQLPPHLAIAFLLDLVAELSPAEAVSLFTLDSASGRLECVASSGDAATSRRMRTAARSILESGFHVTGEDSHVRAVAVTRWDRPFAALVARGRPESTGRLALYLSETAAVVSPLFEREMLFDRNAARERTLVSASERRLARLGCDLHDGPLQEIVAFAEELRLVREQVGSLVDASDDARVRGRFDDLEARLGSLDQGLRDISHAVRSNGAVEQPLEHVLRNELDAFVRATGITSELAVDGDVATLTASQRIVLFRVVQEALANARRHSAASQVRVRLRSTRAYVTVFVSDDGCGFDVDRVRSSGRLGLSGLAERARLLGGDVEIESAPGAGAQVRVTLPQWRPVDAGDASVYAVTA